MTLTLPLFFIESVHLSVEQGAAMLLTVKLSSFPTVSQQPPRPAATGSCANAQTIKALGLVLQGFKDLESVGLHGLLLLKV